MTTPAELVKLPGEPVASSCELVRRAELESLELMLDRRLFTSVGKPFDFSLPLKELNALSALSVIEGVIPLVPALTASLKFTWDNWLKSLGLLVLMGLGDVLLKSPEGSLGTLTASPGAVYRTAGTGITVWADGAAVVRSAADMHITVF